MTANYNIKKILPALVFHQLDGFVLIRDVLSLFSIVKLGLLLSNQQLKPTHRNTYRTLLLIYDIYVYMTNIQTYDSGNVVALSTRR